VAQHELEDAAWDANRKLDDILRYLCGEEAEEEARRAASS